MKFTPEVIAALETLKNAAENDFERHRIDVLEKDLTDPPKVEIIDENHQQFCGIKFWKDRNNNHFVGNVSLHRSVYEYYFGEIPIGYEIHHRDLNTSNNKVENLQMLTKSEHTRVHFESQTGRFAKKTLICQFCGEEFAARYHGNNRFCSEKCRAKARRIECKEERICQFCGKKFLIQNYEQVRYCSVSCAQKDRQKGQHIIKKCPVCGKEFECCKGKSTNKTYCSPECAHIFLASGGREIKVCKNCGKEFSVAKSRRAIYCSRECYFEARNKHS